VDTGKALSITSEDRVLAVVQSQTAFYRTFQLDGPCVDPFTQKALPEQLPSFITALRTGDFLMVAIQNIPRTQKVEQCIRGLATAMLGAAGRGVMYERPDHLVSEMAGVKAVTDLTQYDLNEPALISENLTVDVLGRSSRNAAVWAPLAHVTKVLVDAGLESNLVYLVEHLSGATDDNDVACVIGNIERSIVDEYAQNGSELLGDVAYELSRSDSAVMQSPIEISKAEYLESEQRRFSSAHTQSRGMHQ